MSGTKIVGCLLVLSFFGTALVSAEPAHDYPTQERVEYVFGCMEELGGANYTSLYKCSCSIDRIADEVSYDEYLTMVTFKRGQQAGGERPEVLREGAMASRYRQLLAQTQNSAAEQCGINKSYSAR
ncbi:hypothetical protein [Marinobacter changyiensis]|uniref:hypothetical protein n=1 Tax=Marinobacter changyiensis TaxID=2604091 RepID=UPI0012652A6D|nr:hypothetical protein [Marinobacter changyiensis]